MKLCPEMEKLSHAKPALRHCLLSRIASLLQYPKLNIIERVHILKGIVPTSLNKI